ncbi:NAD-dependent epimerase/dehydratase family protein [Massilia pseudoviolaceinigra]|uniref:NAD-dependent epimerase/dehydratase family protein n=1 Tax=Massilia pseudoviolaceinigra TaxID=3057165 RepID=UPI00279686A1|nr:NAD-dependent epimerase/dehydratase family protein [Massilia sp. CCM 9206]MDQ1921563.1 NAD-dependent epimerase/dehydratase family protein [Massilia sp. CCM 9206]
MSADKPIVLITGSEGRIGTAIAARLSDAYRVVGLERQCKGPDCIDADIASEAALAQAFDTLRSSYGGRIASVIHLAAFYDFSDEPDPLYEAVNVMGTRNLLRALQSFEVGQFIYASTMLVHAPSSPGRLISETSPLAPAWPYPQSKLAAERIVEAERGTTPSVIFRIAGVYTDDCELPSLAHQIERIFERQMLSRVFPGDASHGQACVHIDDVAAAFRAAVDRRARLAQETTVLIGEPVAESYETLQNLIAWLLHGEPWETRRIPKAVAAAGAWFQQKAEIVVPDAIDRGQAPFVKPFMVRMADEHYELDISRAQTLLDWRPAHSLRRSLQTIIARLRADPPGWYRRNKLTLPLWLEDVRDAGAASARMIADYNMTARAGHRQTLWCHFANMALGMWLIASPFAFGLAQQWMQAGTTWAPNGRGLAYSASWMTASDIAAGLLVILFGLFSLSRDFGWARWSTAAVGLWLLFAPILFWTSSPAAYANDTLVGALLIIFAVALPAPPAITPVARISGPDAPPGWDYSPSGWTNRLPIIALALVGLVISRYLAAFQLGHIDAAWDPFFGDGTERIITSSVSEAWPVADAGLGASVYVLEIVTGVIGDKRRWRTMPWLVLLFGVLIVPLGAVSVFFIIIQPIVIGTWCTLCLIGALAMLLQIPYSFDEILATLQFLKARRRQGRPLWYVMLRGDTMDGGSADYSDNFEAPIGAILREMLLSGVSVPSSLLASTAIGVALMCTRLLFGTADEAADNDHIIGSLIVTFSIMAWGEVARPLRFANIGFGAWLLAAPWLLAGYSSAAAIASIFFGIALIVLANLRGRIVYHFGAWDKIAHATIGFSGKRLRSAEA